VAFMIGAIMYGTVAITPLFYQTMMGYTALLSGLILVPVGIGAFFGAIFSAGGSRYFDNKVLIALGLILVGIASLLLGNINLQVALNSMVIPFFILGFGTTMVFVPLATTALGTLAAKDMGNGSGLFNLMRNIGGSVGIAISTTMLARMGQTHQVNLVGQLTPFNPLYQQATKASPGIADGLFYQELLRQSTFLSFVDCFRWYGIIAFFCVFMVLLFRKVENKGMSMVH
ncbi:MAG: MFS transporter, partial [Candidatus Omnitrophica bacterium]|nr:MFS transporter [Candidatus Omnitrophota bacterium]